MEEHTGHGCPNYRYHNKENNKNMGISPLQAITGLNALKKIADDRLPAGAGDIILRPGAPTNFMGTMLVPEVDADGNIVDVVVVNDIKSTVDDIEKILLTDLTLVRQVKSQHMTEDLTKLRAMLEAGDPEVCQHVLTGSMYLKSARLYVRDDDGGRTDVPMPDNLEESEQSPSVPFQKFATNVPEAERLAEFMQSQAGWKTPEMAFNPERQLEVFRLAVPVPNEASMTGAQIISERIRRCNVTLDAVTIGKNIHPKTGKGFYDLLRGYSETTMRAVLATLDPNEAVQKSATRLRSCWTGTFNGEIDMRDGKPFCPVLPHRADVGRITIGDEVFDLWTRKAVATDQPSA